MKIHQNAQSRRRIQAKQKQKPIHTPHLGQNTSMVLAVFINQIRPLIKLQKEEKLANLITYAFTINQVPQVFREYYFVGHKHKYMKDFTER
jgi:hypothetical protein